MICSYSLEHFFFSSFYYDQMICRLIFVHRYWSMGIYTSNVKFAFDVNESSKENRIVLMTLFFDKLR